jgi:succinate-acetate transporter protein
MERSALPAADAASPPQAAVASARITLRPIGSPLTVAMSGLAIASLVQSGLDLHWISSTQGHDVGLVLISVPFMLQIIACVLAYLARDGATAAAVGVLSTSWLAMGLIRLRSAPGSHSGALGLMLLAAGAVLALSSSAVAAAKPLPGLVFMLAALRFIVAGIAELGGGSFPTHAAGIIGCAVVGLAGYSVVAFELEGQRHRPVLPTFRRGLGRAAISGDLVTQLEGAANEAGVRRTT